MPLGNQTGMTDDEREKLGRWIARSIDDRIPTTDEQAAIGARAETMLSELGAISAEPNRLIRLFLSPEHRRAADLVAGWMRDAGMTVTEDALGTVRGHGGRGGRASGAC